MKKSHKSEFLNHIIAELCIIFTVEETKQDGSMPFLDILKMSKQHGTLETQVHRKYTHTDLYLQWESLHTIPSKYSVISTFFHRAKAVCSNQQLLHQEQAHLEEVLQKCKYPKWAMNRRKYMSINKSIPGNNSNHNNNQQNKSTSDHKKKFHIVVPYMQGLSKCYKNMWKTWHTSILQRRLDHQRPPGGSQE